MRNHWSAAALVAIIGSALLSSIPAQAQVLIVDYVDGTSATIPIEHVHPGLVVEKSAQAPVVGEPLWLSIAVDMADGRFVDTLEDRQGVTDPSYVQSLFRMVAGTHAYDNIVGSFKNDSHGAFAPRSEFMGVYQSTREFGDCSHEDIENAATEIWPQVEDDASARGIDLSEVDGLVFWFPKGHACQFAGFAYTSRVGLFGHPCRLAFTLSPSASTASHEIGHTLDWRHSGCLDRGGNLVEYCEAGKMGAQKGYVDGDGRLHYDHPENLRRAAAHNQFNAGWNEVVGRRTFIDVTRSGTYRISAHDGPAEQNDHPQLLIIPGSTEGHRWFISLTDGSGFNPDQNVEFYIANHRDKLIIRSQAENADGTLDHSIREAPLGVGKCTRLDARFEVCFDALMNGEEADVRIRFDGPQYLRIPGVRRMIPMSPKERGSWPHPISVQGGQ